MKMHQLYQTPRAQNPDVDCRRGPIKILFLSIFIFTANQFVFAQQILYSSNFGNNGTALGTLTPEWISSGSNHLQISTNALSNNYISPVIASGGGNLCDCGNSTGTAAATLSTEISTINFEEIRVIFGYRQTAAYTGAVNLEWSIDGITWNNLPFTMLNNGSWSLANTTWLTLPAIANNQTNLRFRFIFSRNSTGQENFRIDDFVVSGKSTAGITQPQHYFRSLKNGQWEYATTWQSSADGIHWTDASLAPGGTAAGITIQNQHTIIINDVASGRLVMIGKGGVLNLTNNVNFTLTDALSNSPDMIISGVFILNGNRPLEITNATYTVEEGGIIKVVNNSGQQKSDDFIHTNPFIKFKTGSIFEWSAPSPFESANKIYFDTSSNEHPIFRISRTLFMGSAAPNHTTINGFVEVSGGHTLYIQNSGIRYFRDGFGGDGSIVMSGGIIDISGKNFTHTRIHGAGSLLLTGGTSGIMISDQGKVSLRSDYIVNGSGFNFTVRNGGKLHCGNYTLYGSANFLLASGAELGIGSAEGISNGSTGNIQTAGRSFDAGGIFQYNGSSNQITGDALPENIQGGVVLKNTGASGNNQITLAKNLLISGFMEFNKGILISNNHDRILSFNNSGEARTQDTNTNNYTAGGHILSFVAGPVRKTGSSDFIFPTGKPSVAFTIPGNLSANGFAGGYRPIAISNLSQTDTFMAEYMVSNPTIWPIKREASDKGLQQISTCEYWILNRSGNARADVTLSWSANALGQSQCNILNMVNPSYLQVVPFSNGAWGDQHDTYFGNSATRAEPETGITYITWKGDNPEHDIDSYEKFVVGSVNTTESPLPSKINGFKAEYYRNKIVIQWRAHHCENLKAFLIEKSRDGKNFKSIISINAKPNQLTETYQEYDPHPHKEWNYYRLCIIDKKGQLQYSDIKKVWIQPNNNTGQIISRIRKNYLHISLINTSAINILTISNLSGQVLYKQNIAMKSISVDISPFVPGLYFLRIIGLSGVHTETFLKE